MLGALAFTAVAAFGIGTALGWMARAVAFREEDERNAREKRERT